MLKQIEIKNFKKIGNNPLIIDRLALINYLVGENGSGKSSVLELLYALFIASTENINWRFNFNGNKFSSERVGTDTHNSVYQIFTMFGNITKLPDIQTSSLKKSFHKIDGDIITEFSYSFDFDYLKTPQGANLPSIHRSRLLFLTNSFEGTYPLLQNPGLGRIEDSISIRSYSNLDGLSHFNEKRNREYQFIVDILNDLIFLSKEDKIKELKPDFPDKDQGEVNQKFIIVYKNGTENELNKLPGGIIFLIKVISVLYQFISVEADTKGVDLILIEEPENSLHPKYQKLLPSLFRKISIEYNIQFIISTHSPFIISKASGLTNQKVYLIEEGQTKDAETEELNTSRSQHGYSDYEAKKTSNKMLGTGLDDLMDKIIFCEGSQLSSKNPEFDAGIYNTIFYGKGYNFVSAGGGNLSDKALFIMKMSEKSFDLDEICVVKDSDLLDQSEKNIIFEEYKSKGLSLIYLEKQCIEAYLYDETVTEIYFKKLDIEASEEFNLKFKERNFETEKNTGHCISNLKIKLIGEEIFPITKKTTPKKDINFSLAEAIRDLGQKPNNRKTPNIYWQLHKSIFGD